MSTRNWLIYGANGYTAHLLAEEAAPGPCTGPGAAKAEVSILDVGVGASAIRHCMPEGPGDTEIVWQGAVEQASPTSWP